MRQIFQVLLWCFVLLAGSASAASNLSTVPAAFRGQWNSLGHCRTRSSDAGLSVTSNRIQFYGSQGPVRAVVTQGKLEIALISELSGEGASWLAYSHFQLSSDHNRLTDVTKPDAKFVRYRCPGSTRSADGS